jgi:general secretion pathway protein G
MSRLRGQGEDEGFTLIELLIVIVILGILAAIVVFSVSGVTDNGKQAACQTNVKTLDTALEAYYAQNTGAASDFNQLVTGGFLHQDQNISTDGKSINEGAYTLTYVAPGGFVNGGSSGPKAGNAGGVNVGSGAPANCTSG